MTTIHGPPPTTYTLTRTGGAAVSFHGRVIAAGHSACEMGPKDRLRSHEVRVYQTRQLTSYVLEIVYRTTWETERDRSTVHILRSADMAGAIQQIIARLADHNPTADVAGYPEGPQFVARQARLLARHQADWDALVSEVLSQLPGATEEIQ